MVESGSQFMKHPVYYAADRIPSFNPIIDSYAALLKCTAMVLVSYSMTASSLSV